MCLMATAMAFAQPMTIKFTIGSELGTTLTGVTDEVIDTEAGPYYFKDVMRLTFQMTLPDSSILEKLRQKNIEVYLRSKRVTPLVTKAAPSNAAPIKEDTRPPETVIPRPDNSAKQGYHAKTAGGVGLGLDYGGIGMKLTLEASGPISLFGGLGYNLDKLGYNIGMEMNFKPSSETTGFLSAMYGYNAVLVQSSGSFSSAKTFYGPSFGLGIKARSRVSENYFTFQIIYPIRDKEFNASGNSVNAWPVLLSLGYNFAK